MSDISIFQKKLCSSTRSVASILHALQPLFGCVYLEDQNSPTISFLPEAYCQLSEHKTDIQTRTNLQHYSHINLDDDPSRSAQQFIKNLIQFQPKPTAAPLEASTASASDHVPDPATIGFQGGYIGFVDYNYAAQQQVSSTASAQPQFYIGRYSSYLKRQSRHWVFYSLDPQAAEIFELLQSLIDPDTAPHRSQAHRSQAHTPPKTAFHLTQACAALWSKAEYQHAFERIQDYIRAGDCYQINLTQQFVGTAQGELLETAEQFWQLTQAPYAAYLKLPDFELLSCSPELFIEFAADRRLITKPIKGTMPRSADPVQDEHYKQQLIHSEKDQAENLMIVDLLRNDLSVYAEVGSVKTPKLFEIESFNQVHHMVSEVSATLTQDTHPFELLMSALPGGSITGAPKIRAMQIIEELEVAPRGAYCGSIGYFNFDGTGRWNILIRSIQKYQDQVSLWAGGGITIASDCDAEYQECFDKVEAMLDLLNTWQLAPATESTQSV